MNASLLSKVVQVAVALVLPLAILYLGVTIAFQGFTLFRPPTAEERAWEVAGIATEILGLTALGVACVKLRKRWPLFCAVAPISGALQVAIQVIDVLN